MSVTPWRKWRVLDKEEEQEKNKREALQNAARADEEYWIPINDWLLKGERRYKDPVTDADLLMFVGGKEHDTPPPPETFYTNFQAKNEVRSILSRKGLTHKRLDEMIAEYKEARDQGIISADEWVKYADQLEDIRSRHLERLEEMVQWFMDEYYRVFDEKLHVVTKIKLTNTRIWQDNQRQEEVQQVMSLPCRMPQKRPKR